jgi:hypothetical protein
MHNYIDPKIDTQAVLGLSGTANSLAYKVNEIEKHFHNSQSVWGSNSGYLGSDYPIKLTVTGGDNAWGTEQHIYAGDNIESGSATKKMDIGKIYIVSVSTADVISVVEFLYGTAGTAITGTVVEGTEVYTRTAGAAMPVDGNKVIVNSVTNITGLLATETYYVTNVSGSTFKLSRTVGGASAALGGTDGTFSISIVTQTTLTKIFVSKAAQNASADAQVVCCPRIACNNHMFVRAKSASGSTIAIGYMLGIHTYTA